VETVLRAVVIFLVLWAVTRIVGRSTLGELSAFELIMFIVMGDLVQQSITQQDYSMTGAVLALATFALLTITLSWLNARFRGAERLLHGRPVIVCYDGEPTRRVMRRERLSMADLREAARQQGIRSVADIRIAILEPNGQLSFFVGDHDEQPPFPPARAR